jgi:hypothetical protein
MAKYYFKIYTKVVENDVNEINIVQDSLDTKNFYVTFKFDKEGCVRSSMTYIDGTRRFDTAEYNEMSFWFDDSLNQVFFANQDNVVNSVNYDDELTEIEKDKVRPSVAETLYNFLANGFLDIKNEIDDFKVKSIAIEILKKRHNCSRETLLQGGIIDKELVQTVNDIYDLIKKMVIILK